MGNRERLVQAAARLFHRQGYAATSVADLLEATGVARSNFYYHFDGKLAVAREAVRRWTSQYHARLDRDWDRGEATVADRVRAMFRLLEGGTDDEDGLLRWPLGVLALELAPHDDGIREALVVFLVRLEARCRELDGEARAGGGLEDGDRGPGTGHVAVTTLVGALAVANAFRDADALPRIRRELLDVLDSGGQRPARPATPRAEEEGRTVAGAPPRPARTGFSGPLASMLEGAG